MRLTKCSLETEAGVISDYLRGNLSTRQLCRKYAELKDKTGFKAHYILKKYNLEPTHKGKLFLLTARETKRIVQEIMKEKHPELAIPKNIFPSILSRYSGTYLIANSIGATYYCLDGELRNNVLKFFRQKKKEIGLCQVDGCDRKDLDCAHKRNYERKKVFENVAKKHVVREGNCLKFSVYDLMYDFLQSHKNGVIYFLCKKHHFEYDKTDDPNNFIKKLRV